ncbi:MAG: hypothetical protein L7F78_24225, partial [Syntrophales bacterium LBB04]|nr:hypothetical protein [Syntrophales bacterium LBB04]
LESDENAVNLVTIHKSKGLEYPIVFCPFSWEGLQSKKERGPFVFHDPQQRMQLTLDLGTEQAGENRVAAEKEALAENLRLFYVALTRAKCRVYLVWGRFRHAAASGPGYLLHPPPPEDLDGSAKSWRKGSRRSNDDLSTLKRLAKQEPVVSDRSLKILLSPRRCRLIVQGGFQLGLTGTGRSRASLPWSRSVCTVSRSRTLTP